MTDTSSTTPCPPPYYVSTRDPIMVGDVCRNLAADLTCNNSGKTQFWIVVSYVLKEELRCHFGVLFEGSNIKCRGQQHDYLLFHHYNKQHRLVGGTEKQIFDELCQGLPKGEVELVLGQKLRYSFLPDNLKKQFRVWKIQPTETSGYICTKDLTTCINLVTNCLVDGNGTCAKNCWRILSALNDITWCGPKANLKKCNIFVKAFLEDETKTYVDCTLPALLTPAVLAKCNHHFQC